MIGTVARKKLLLGGLALGVVAALATARTMVVGGNVASTGDRRARPISTVKTEQLGTVVRSKSLFGRQSVGWNTLDGVPRHFAARLAAKEATLKALHGRWTRVPWRDVEIVHDETGAPTLVLSGQLRSHVESNGILDLRVSLAHCDAFATATMIAKEG